MHIHSDWGGAPRPLWKGSTAHKALGRALALGYTTLPSHQEIIDVVRPEFEDLHGPMRQSAIQEVMTSLAMYFRHFPLERGTRFVGAEVAVYGGVLDLLFEHPGGGLVADEVKTGRLVDACELRKLGDQVVRQTVGAVMRFGDRFLGTRAIVLGRIGESYMLTPSGTRLPVVGVPPRKGVIA